MANQDVRSMRKDGTEFPASVSFGDVHVGGQRLFTALISDNTERRRITEALRASESQLRQITDTVPALIAYLDLEQRFRFHNRAYEEVLGLEFKRIDGHTLADVLGPQLYEGVQDKVDEALRGYAVQYERVQVTPQGDLQKLRHAVFPLLWGGRGRRQGRGIFLAGHRHHRTQAHRPHEDGVRLDGQP
ncbi:PAS domain S-box protein [Polaromonas sp. P1(28)-8]|nr:PAS domain S-box protein [Polaromonas sp. P1(28)-8]